MEHDTALSNQQTETVGLVDSETGCERSFYEVASAFPSSGQQRSQSSPPEQPMSADDVSVCHSYAIPHSKMSEEDSADVVSQNGFSTVEQTCHEVILSTDQSVTDKTKGCSSVTSMEDQSDDSPGTKFSYFNAESVWGNIGQFHSSRMWEKDTVCATSVPNASRTEVVFPTGDSVQYDNTFPIDSSNISHPPSDPNCSSSALCNLQLMTFSYENNQPKLKLVNIKDTIIISVDFTCKVCRKKFLSSDELNEHIKEHADSPVIKPMPTNFDRPSLNDKIKDLLAKIVNASESPSLNQTTDVASDHPDLVGHVPEEGSENKPTVCRICNKQFDHKDMWTHYRDIHLSEGVSQCYVCGKEMSNDRELLKHLIPYCAGLRKPPTPVFCCSVCDKRFDSELFLLNHMLQIHPEGQSISFQTPKTKTPPSTQLPTEERSTSACTHCDGTGVLPARKYQCRICSNAFRDSRDLQQHLTGHNEQTICQVCHKVVMLRSLPKHMTLHTKPKAYPCPHCDKAYREKCDLTKHMRKHTGEKPYLCEICHKSFAYSSQLPRHLRTHSGEKPYKCATCQKVFTRRFGLQQHMASHNTKEQFKCTECGKKFCSLTILQKHVVKHSDKKQNFLKTSLSGSNISG